MGAKRALLVISGDILKAVAAIAIGAFLFQSESIVLGKWLAGAFVIIGHVLPVYFGFRGGKGVLTSAAVILMFDYRVLIGVLVVFLVIVLTTKYISLGSLIAAISLPFFIYYFYPGNLLLTGIAAILTVFLTLMHRSNIQRLRNGTESKFKFKGDKAKRKEDKAK